MISSFPSILLVLFSLLSSVNASFLRRFLQNDPAAPFALSAGLVGSGQAPPTGGVDEPDDEGANVALIGGAVTGLLLLCCCCICCIAAGAFFMFRKKDSPKESVTVPYGGSSYSDTGSRGSANRFD